MNRNFASHHRRRPLSYAITPTRPSRQFSSIMLSIAPAAYTMHISPPASRHARRRLTRSERRQIFREMSAPTDASTASADATRVPFYREWQKAYQLTVRGVRLAGIIRADDASSARPSVNYHDTSRRRMISLHARRAD